MRKLVLLFYLTLLLAVLGGAVAVGWHFGRASTAKQDQRIYTCSMHMQIRHAGPGLCPICSMELTPLDSLAPDRDGAVTIDPVVVQSTGIRVAEVRRGPLVATLRSFGSLVEPQPAVHEVALKTGGFVEKLHADTEGMAIAAGAPLLELFAPSLILAQEELLAAKKGGDPELLEAARTKLRLLDVDPAEIAEIEAAGRPHRTLRFVSPIAGTLVKKDVVPGAAVEASKPILRIADLTTLWLDVQVYEHQLALAQVGLEVTALVDALPGETFTGRLVFVAPVLDPASRTATARITLANADLRLKPGMYARAAVTVTLDGAALLVPREAVLDSGVRQVAFVALAKGRFQPRVLRLGRSGDGGVVEVLAGLAEGEAVVTSGQLLLDSEARLREGMQKLSGENLAATRPSTAPALPLLALSDAQHAQVDTFVRAYLLAAERLAADRWDAALVKALAQGAADLSGPELAPHREALAAAIAQLEGTDLAAARKAFVAVSDAAIRLVDAAPPSAAVAKELHVVHCPMVKASWLQSRPEVANPYDSDMPRCGDIERRIPAHAERPK